MKVGFTFFIFSKILKLGDSVFGTQIFFSPVGDNPLLPFGGEEQGLLPSGRSPRSCSTRGWLDISYVKPPRVDISGYPSC